METILPQERRRRQLPSPTPLQPKRHELIQDIYLEEPNPAHYDHLYRPSEEPGTPTMSPHVTKNCSHLAELKLHRIAEVYPGVQRGGPK